MIYKGAVRKRIPVSQGNNKVLRIVISIIVQKQFSNLNNKK